MKLLTRTTLYILYFSILAFIASGFIFYLSIRTIINKQIDSSLITEKNIIQEQIEHTDTIPDFKAAFGHLIEVKIFDKVIRKKEILKDTLVITENANDEDIPYRSLFFANNTKNNKGYTISILQQVSEKKDLLEDISTLLLILFILLMLIFVIVNYWISKRLWIPFYKSLDLINSFEITSRKTLDFEKTDIEEFNRLNQVLDKMSEKIKTDYFNLKEFNENASHEIQTPLAVIRSKLELLSQNENLSFEQISILQSINEAVTKLSKLNKGLILISKIDNQQFTITAEVNIGEIIERFLFDFEEIIQLKKIRVIKEFDSLIVCFIDPLLAEILISNLISNAVRHNIIGGNVTIKTFPNLLVISNTGKPLLVDPETLFNRFIKHGTQTDSVGLGLSIVKKIVAFYNFKITYAYINDTHEVKVFF